MAVAAAQSGARTAGAATLFFFFLLFFLCFLFALCEEVDLSLEPDLLLLSFRCFFFASAAGAPGNFAFF